jgi:Ca-activated chloride channel family protein
VGTRAGDVVPVLDEQGRALDIKRDASGAAVKSRLDEPLLRSLAQRTRGAYFAASRPGGDLPRLLFMLGGLSRAARGERLVERPVARFPLCALLAAELARPRRRRAQGEAAAALHSERAVAAAALAIVALPLWAPTAAAQSAWARGDRAFRAGSYARAESLYAQRAKGDPRPEVIVNHATARALKGERRDAASELTRVAGRSGAAGEAARYNLGTVLGQEEEFDRGLEALRTALERAPGDEDARWNYEVLLRRKREREQQPQQKQQRPPSNPQQPAPGAQPQGGGQQQPPGGNPQPNPAPQAGPSPPGPPPSGGSEGMTRGQAEQLLGALQEVERNERLRQQRLRVKRERREKDW